MISMLEKVKVLELNVDNINLKDIIVKINKAIKNNSTRPVTFCSVNTYTLRVVEKNKRYLGIFNSFDVLLPEGIGVVLTSKILKNKLSNRVAGPDVFMALNEYANLNSGFSYFFLGSSDDVLKKIKARLTKEFPNISCTQVYSPPFGEWSAEENQNIINLINKVKPTVLWVGMTQPKQETWIYQNKENLNVKVIGAVGAAFDYFAGSKKRPQWMISLGIGWLYRLISEPARLWQRYFQSFLLLFWLLIDRKKFKSS